MKLLRLVAILLAAWSIQTVSAATTIKVRLGEGVNWWLYVYNSAGEDAEGKMGRWPGELFPAETADADGWYTITFETIGTVVFNNNYGNQTVDLTAADLEDGLCYEIVANNGGNHLVNAVACVEEPAEPATIRVKQTVGLNWALHVYTSDGTFGEWPGDGDLTPDNCGWYTLDFPDGIPGFVIFNNGNSGEGNQTANLDFLEDGLCYEISAVTATAVDCPEPVEPVTVQVKLAEGLDWGLHVYSSTGEFGAWPGELLEADVNGWYSITFNCTTGTVVFNNGFSSGDSQTGDITFLEDGKCYEISTEVDPTYNNRIVNPIECGGMNINSPRTKFAVYPNPVLSTLSIQGAESIQAVIILNASGNKVMQATPINQTIQVDRLAAGIYFLKLQGKEDAQYVKFIKK